jgi:NitT/TauT family transport system permease protein
MRTTETFIRHGRVVLREREGSRGEQMSLASPQIESPAELPSNVERRLGIVADSAVVARVAAARLPTLLALPLTTAIALGVHFFVSETEPPAETRSYTIFLGAILGAAIAMVAMQPRWPGLRRWMRNMCPVLAAAVVLLCLWEVVTSGLRLLPLPYFPSPAGVLRSLVIDRSLLFDSTWHSLILLASGYAMGVVAGLISGICIGWFSSARYWGMPVLKVVGPIPATAWIPLAMVVSPSTIFSAGGLIALAVWFPVTMLTASGVSNTRASYLDVARTLGAGRAYLIFRVAIPAALPSIFVGLFMGLGASFLTLVVAETVGVKSGLGWYVSWAQAWAEYGKVYAALVIMAAFFSTIMTVLFKVRDRVLAWQKGMIKW